MTIHLQASGSWDKTVKLWNSRNGRLLHTLSGHTGWVQALAFSNDGIYVASASDDDTVRVWDVVNGNCIKTLEVGGVEYALVLVLLIFYAMFCFLCLAKGKALSRLLYLSQLICLNI